jgi:hypothetical protein
MLLTIRVCILIFAVNFDFGIMLIFSHYISTDEDTSHSFELDGSFLTLREAPFDVPEKYVVKILSIETGYNKVILVILVMGLNSTPWRYVSKCGNRAACVVNIGIRLRQMVSCILLLAYKR